LDRQDDRETQEASTALVTPALVVAVIAISFAAIFFRKAAPTHPLVSACIRLTIASALLAPFLFRAWDRGEITARMAWYAAGAGVLYGVHFGAWVWSLEMTTVAASVTIVTATPLLLAIVAVVTGTDKPDARLWISIGLAAVGLSLIGGYDVLVTSTEALIGDGLALLGAAAMAGYLLIGRRLGDELHVLGFAAIATFVGAICTGLAATAVGIPLEPASFEALFYLALAALIPQLIGHNLLTWSLRHASPTSVGIATVGEPVGATLLGWFWLGEHVSPIVMLGCSVTLVGVLIAVVKRRR
jgi:drug/metabolite transporter (DMT)-like permease